MESLKPDPASVAEQLAGIFSSPQFRESHRLQAFLRFIVSLALEGRADEIKESTIASEVFGRADVPDDSIVRSAARRLRTRLEEYYQQDGATDSVRIVIPKGSYVPDFYEQPRAETEIAPTTLSTGKTFVRSRWVGLSAAAILVVCAAAAGWQARRQPQRHNNAEARELYLKGRFYWSKRTPEDLNRAVDYFTQAVVKDPQDAQAYAGLADTYNLLSEYTAMPCREAFKRSMAAAQTAIELDDTLPEAHNSLAFAEFYGSWNSVLAEREFRRALQLDSKCVSAHHWYATFLMSVGRENEALSEIERARALDPSSRSIVADKGLILTYAGRIAAGKTLLEEIALRDPQFLSPHLYLAPLYLLEKRYSDYLSESRKISLLSQDRKALTVVEAGETGLAAGGAANMLTGMLRAQEASSAGEESRYYRLAQMCASLGNKNKAIEYLQSAFGQHDTNLLVLTIDPCFTQMRGDDAFREIVSRVRVAQNGPRSRNFQSAMVLSARGEIVSSLK